MTALFVRSRDGASPRMLAVSALLHGLMLLIVVLCSASLHKPTPTPPEEVSRVVLVGPEAGIPPVEKVQRGPMKSIEPTVSENSPEIEDLAQPSEPKREIVQAEKLTKAEIPATIRLAKRKKPPQRLEAPKKPEQKPAKKEPAPPEKKESPETFLENRLATLRKNMESRKSNPAPRQSVREAKGLPGQGSRGSQRGGETEDAELARYLSRVKIKVNANWLLPSNDRQVERVTVVGVQIAENGALVNVAVDSTSGDDFFDKSAMRAVLQAAPFPPPQPEVAQKITSAGGLALRFTPRGMQ
jgi:TonB family protein